MSKIENQLIHNLSFAEYQAIPAVSNSSLKHMLKSPAHCRYYMDNPAIAESEAMKLGTALHCAILEPGRFDDHYIPLPRFDRRTKVGKEQYELLVNQYGDERLLPTDDHSAVIGMRRSVWAHSAARSLLEKTTATELSGTWIDSLSVVACKMRIDALAENIAVIDVKTTQDASEYAFTKAIFNFGYHRQGAMYLSGMRAMGVEIEHYVIIAVEKTPPYAVAVYRLTDETLAAGKAQLEDLLAKYAACSAANQWPAYPDFVQDISLPEWGFKQIEALAA